jgi:hypothetical protein
LPTRLLSLRLDKGTLDQIEARARGSGEPRSKLIQRLVEEGLRMESHPGILFRSGPAGRRAAVSQGPDVWEIVRVVRNVKASGEEAIDQAARWLGLTRTQVQAAVRYYAAYKEEVDAWIRRVDQEASEAETLWHREQELLAH